MLRIFKYCMFWLSFSPLWASIIAKEIFSLCSKNDYIVTEIVFLSVIGLFSAVSIIIMRCQWVKSKKKQGTEYKVESIQKEKTLTAEYIIAYVLPLFAFDFSKWQDIILFAIFFLTIGFLCIRNRHVYANIILEIIGYKTYHCTATKKTDEIYHDENLNLSKEFFILSRADLSGKAKSYIRLQELHTGYQLNITTKEH